MMQILSFTVSIGAYCVDSSKLFWSCMIMHSKWSSLCLRRPYDRSSLDSNTRYPSVSLQDAFWSLLALCFKNNKLFLERHFAFSFAQNIEGVKYFFKKGLSIFIDCVHVSWCLEVVWKSRFWFTVAQLYDNLRKYFRTITYTVKKKSFRLKNVFELRFNSLACVLNEQEDPD